MTNVKPMLVVLTMFVMAGCSSPAQQSAADNPIPPLSLRTDEGAYANPTTAPRQVAHALRESGIAGDSGLERASSTIDGD